QPARPDRRARRMRRRTTMEGTTGTTQPTTRPQRRFPKCRDCGAPFFWARSAGAWKLIDPEPVEDRPGPGDLWLVRGSDDGLPLVAVCSGGASCKQSPHYTDHHDTCPARGRTFRDEEARLERARLRRERQEAGRVPIPPVA